MATQKQAWTLIQDVEKFNINTYIIIVDDELHYLSRVLRLAVGDSVEITNCQGTKAFGEINSITKKECSIKIKDVNEENLKLKKVHVCLALPKPSTLEDLVAIVSEMGLEELHLFRTEKCASKAPVKLDKLQKISNEAVRISKSSFSTKIFYYESKEELLLKSKNFLENGLNLFCDESHVYENKVTNSLLGVLKNNYNNQENINIIVGPEASFSDTERQWIEEKIKPYSVSLGQNILRVPNAVSAAFSVVNHFLMG